MKPLSFSDPDLVSHSVVISASAGSGKTYTLSVLVLLSLGRMEAKSYEIMATTFSEAAAADLRERLLRPLDLLNSFSLDSWEKLLSHVSDNSKAYKSIDISSGELLEAFRHFGIQPWMETPDAAQTFWRRTRREAELMHISTLHGMALGLLRSGNKSPDKILEADHPALLRTLRQALREITDTPESDPDYAPACELLKWAEKQWKNISFGHDSHRDAMGHYGELAPGQIRTEIKNALDVAQTSIRPFVADPDLAKNPASQTLQHFRPKKILPLPKSCSTIYEQIKWAERQSLVLDSEAEKLPGYYSNEFKNAIKTLQAVSNAWETWLKITLSKSLQRFEEVKQIRRLATFGDIVRTAIDGLNDGSILPPRPRLLLVDEYQDTSLAQDAFLNALEAERIIRVGDVKQAIYGFRGGTPDLLKKQIVDAGDSAFRLPYNFRSTPPIVELSNAFVDKVWPMADPSAEHLESLQIPKASGKCPVGIVLHQSPSKGTDLPSLSEWITALSHESGWKNVIGTDTETKQHSTRALLLRQRTKLPTLLIQLKKSGIQPYVLANDGFWDSPGVRLMMAAMEAYAHPNRKLPCAILLRHIIGLTDNEINYMGAFKGIDSINIEAIPSEKRQQVSFFQTLKSASTHQIASHLLTQGKLLAIVASLDAHGAMEPERARRNLAGFLAMLQGLPANPGIAYAILDELRRGAERGDLPSMSQDADLVIQTVHGSKGLEYDDVILPLLNNRKKNIRKGWMLTDQYDRLLRFAWRLGVEPGNDYRQIAELTDLQQRRDNLNLFYVAITRAKKRMCLLIQVPPKIKENHYYSWARLGMELYQSNDKSLNLEHPPLIAPRYKSGRQQLEKQPNKLMPIEPPISASVQFDDSIYAERERSRQEGLEMHVYLQNLLVRWSDTEAFNCVLNNPPQIPNAMECALQFLKSFELRGWRHLRRRTEMVLADTSQSRTKGRADLVVWDQDYIHIIDFKHVHKLTAETEELYTQQLNRYSKALRDQGLPIKGWLALLKSGEWKEVPIGKNDGSTTFFLG